MSCLSYLILIFFLFNIFYTSQCSESEEPGKRYDITWLRPGTRYQVDDHQDLSRIFCHCADHKTVLSSLRSLYVELRGTTSYKFFEGMNASEVVHQYQSHLSSWLPLLPWRQTQFAIPVFSNYCIGITSETSFQVALIERKINYWRVLQLLSGVILFVSSPTLCRNIFFYYSAGISIGVVASLIILIFIFSRFMPRKTAAYGILILGYSMVLYLVQLLWFNMREVFLDYSNYLLGYIAVSAIFSFAFCYRYKPMTDTRSQDLIQWAFQLCGLMLVFFSSEFHEFSLALVLIIVLMYNFPAVWLAKIRTWWHRKFPPRIKLLSEAEYIQQGCEETSKGVEELRGFCQSPNCHTWRLVSRLKDPLRFAKFVEGESHLTDEEILKYDTDLMTLGRFDVEVTDDESSSDEGVASVSQTPSASRMREMFS